MNWKLALIVAAGGAIGTLCRFGLAWLMTPISQSMPWGTIVINIVGSFVIGAFGTLTLAEGRHPAPEAIRLFVMVGICGGFTTFSSFSLQTFDLLRNGAPGRAALNVAVSVAACLVAVAAGHYTAARFSGGDRAVAQLDIEELG
jgi:CrcB protein